jgi:hypothetical protein
LTALVVPVPSNPAAVAFRFWECEVDVSSGGVDSIEEEIAMVLISLGD